MKSTLRSYRFFATAVFITAFVLSSCREDPPTDDQPGDTYDRKPMLENIGDNIIIPAYQNLANKVDTLDLYADAFIASPTQVTLDSLRAAWKRSLLSWQEVAIFEFGPASTVLLRDNVNIYPVDSAVIDSNYINGGYDLNVASNYDAKGFQALDYLLYGLGPDDPSILAAYTTDQYASNRMTYLQDIIADIDQKVNTVLNNWLPSGGNYIETFKSNTGTAIGSSTSDLVNAFNYHYERYIRSGKIGIPSGVLLFTQTPQPDKVEALYNRMISVELTLAAIQGIENVYHGIGANGDDVGFYEYLEYLETSGSSGLLADDIASQIDLVQTEVATLNEPLYDEIVNNQQKVFDVYGEMQSLVVYFKNDMTSAMGVIITYADADGD